jgi:hypothetical protein
MKEREFVLTYDAALTRLNVLEVSRGALADSLRDGRLDLSAWQLVKLLDPKKPAVTRALDKLSVICLIRHAADEGDRHSILV